MLTSVKKFIFPAILLIFIGFIFGRLSNNEALNNSKSSKALRQGGYRYIDPLLLCDFGAQQQPGEENKIGKKIKEIVDSAIINKEIDSASIYFRDLISGEWTSVNENEHYLPSSLGKIPILISYLKLAEENPGILDKTLFYNGNYDDNKQQEIIPEVSLVAGKSYPINELLFLMIAYSDNNSTRLLYQNLDPVYIKDVYSSLSLPFKNNSQGPEATDLLTVREYSRFFRILFNSTYLSRESSEAVLKALTKVTFAKGLRAGIPKDIEISHKFGLASILDPISKKITSRELHDCGIIYTKNPYLLCVMTKSSAPLSKVENFISSISEIAYKNSNN